MRSQTEFGNEKPLASVWCRRLACTTPRTRGSKVRLGTDQGRPERNLAWRNGHDTRHAPVAGLGPGSVQGNPLPPGNGVDQVDPVAFSHDVELVLRRLAV